MKRSSVLFVCLGNICRSPLAEGVFRDEVARRGVEGLVRVDSCGTGGWHVGEAPDPRSVEVAQRHGLDISHQRARQLRGEDFYEFVWMIPMDRSNERVLAASRPDDHDGLVRRYTTFVPGRAPEDVPDPYYGGPRGFDDVFDLIRRGAGPLLDEILADLEARR
ncbi:MAG: low molecular weight protein-tyrosine-phosphatase [Myxococcota bacterium]